jgi:hypothetical protein
MKATVYLCKINGFPPFNEAFSEYFLFDPPRRRAFQVIALPLSAAVLIEMVALAA